MDEALFVELQCFIVKSLVYTGDLPEGMKELKDRDHYFWSPIFELIRAKNIPILLSQIKNDSKESDYICLVLQVLEILCLCPSAIDEIVHCNVFSSISNIFEFDSNDVCISYRDNSTDDTSTLYKKGLEVLLGVISIQCRFLIISFAYK
jgi:hypothetical protein